MQPSAVIRIRMSLFAELKRRNVFRVAIAYLFAAWLVLQVSELVLDAIEAPSWVLKVFLLIFALGFPFALLFSWAYELTPEGIKREVEVDRTQSVTHNTGKKLDQITIAMVIALALFIVYDRSVPSASDTAEQQTQAEDSAAPAAEKSIAVLAFEDLSPDGDQEYFADGLSEELLNVLAQKSDLQVAGRTSSFAFKGQNRDLREIGEILNVAHILEGSVRKAGNKIRVTAQLINAETGFHLFSETYDRDLTDVFAVQDEIAASISGTLHAELVGTVTKQAAETAIEAYDLYLIARQKIHTRDKAEMQEAARLLDRALEIDSEYAPALAQRALAWHLLSDNVGSYGEIPQDEAEIEARRLLDRAVAIDPNLAETQSVIGLLMLSDDQARADEIVSQLEFALNLNPNLDNTRNWLATAYGIAARNVEAQELLESVVERDPLYGPAFNNLIQRYTTIGGFDQANALIGRVERIIGETPDVDQAWGAVALAKGEPARAIRHFKRVYDDNPSGTVGRLWYGFALNAIGEYETIVEIGAPIPKIFALDSLGRHDEARALVDELTPVRLNNAFINVASNHFHVTKNFEQSVAYVEDHFGDVDKLLKHFESPDGTNSGHLTQIAFAYLQVGREDDFRKLTSALVEALQRRSAAGENNFQTRGMAISVAMFTGSDKDILDAIGDIVDWGATSPVAFDDQMFDGIRSNPEFLRLQAIVEKRANDERAKLGLPPFQKSLPASSVD